jgi:hypothetical protein
MVLSLFSFITTGTSFLKRIAVLKLLVHGEHCLLNIENKIRTWRTKSVYAEDVIGEKSRISPTAQHMGYATMKQRQNNAFYFKKYGKQCRGVACKWRTFRQHCSILADNVWRVLVTANS